MPKISGATGSHVAVGGQIPNSETAVSRSVIAARRGRTRAPLRMRFLSGRPQKGGLFVSQMRVRCRFIVRLTGRMTKRDRGYRGCAMSEPEILPACSGDRHGATRRKQTPRIRRQNAWRLSGAFSVPTVRIGLRLGLFDALHSGGPATSDELAKRAGGLTERYVRGWALAQAANGFVDYDATSQKFSLSPEQAMVFAEKKTARFIWPEPLTLWQP